MSKLRMREARRDERGEAQDEQVPMLMARCPGSEFNSSTPSYMVLEQWDENRGGWFAVPITWE